MVMMGRVGGAYGVRGMVRVVPLSEDPLALLQHAQWWLRLRDDEAWQPRQVSDARAHGGALVAMVEGVADRESAERLRGAAIGLPRAALPVLAENEFYWSDLEGLAVVNREGVALGRVVGLIDNGAHPILRVQEQGAAERLIPWVPVHVERVDVAAGRIEVDWPADA